MIAQSTRAAPVRPYAILARVFMNHRTPTREARSVIKAIIFDFDGLIVDTETPEYQSWQEIFQEYGAELDLDLWQSFIGRGFGDFDVYEHLARVSGKPVDRATLRPRMRKRYLDLIERNPILPGVEAWLRRAKALGLPLAVASSSRQGWASGHLEKRGLLPNFAFVHCGDDVANVKPDPEIYIITAKRLGVPPENALAIEDSLNGLTAAKAAGMRCVVAPNPMTRQMNFAAADLRLNSLADATLDCVLAQLTAPPSRAASP